MKFVEILRLAGPTSHQRPESHLVIHLFLKLVDNEPDISRNYNNNRVKIKRKYENTQTKNI